MTPQERYEHAMAVKSPQALRLALQEISDHINQLEAADIDELLACIGKMEDLEAELELLTLGSTGSNDTRRNNFVMKD